jgi:hypothetical protein
MLGVWRLQADQGILWELAGSPGLNSGRSRDGVRATEQDRAGGDQRQAAEQSPRLQRARTPHFDACKNGHEHGERLLHHAN